MRIDEEEMKVRAQSGFDGRNQVSCGRNQVSLEGIRFRWKESGFAGRNQVSDGCVVNMVRCYGVSYRAKGLRT